MALAYLDVTHIFDHHQLGSFVTIVSFIIAHFKTQNRNNIPDDQATRIALVRNFPTSTMQREPTCSLGALRLCQARRALKT